MVPIYILVMGFPAKLAIPLSNVTILGGSIMNMAMNVQKRWVVGVAGGGGGGGRSHCHELAEEVCGGAAVVFWWGWSCVCSHLCTPNT